MTQQCAVAGLPRETNDGYFDAANANKACVRVHGGQSSEFPIYPTTRERGITTLETRRLRGDQIEVFKILNGYENIDSNIFFSKLKKVK